MLTDIFSNRYLNVKLRDQFAEADRRLLVQSFRILVEQVCPYYDAAGNVSEKGKNYWSSLNSLLAMEFGLQTLSPIYYSYQTTWNGAPHTQTGSWSFDTVCKNWMLADYDGLLQPDVFIKERLSLVELGFRKREIEIAEANAALPNEIASAKLRAARRTGGIRLPGDLADGMKAFNYTINEQFQSVVVELNARFRQAGYDLNYHNGFIQRSSDALTEKEIESPFWKTLANPKWKNVDIDMKEAIDRRDSNARDPAFYAARALESTIKVVSAEKGWTHGNEKGAHNYIDNLSAKQNGLIHDWEAKLLKDFFSKVRNPLGHGPGQDEMPNLSSSQTDWAIETCMSWIKSITQRI